MIIRSKAPLRIGFAGGGTDVSPYCDIHGGAVLNATINMFSYCTLEPRNDGKIIFDARDIGIYEEYDSISKIDSNLKLPLHIGIYNRIIKDYNNSKPLSFKITTYADAPPGSGLGSSSTMVVAMIKAYMEWLNLPLGEYDMAMLAYVIEREDLNLSGGKQDQYAATFGGFNYIEFYDDYRVIVNPLRIKNWIKNEVENSLILYYTGISRDSSLIIEDQIKNTSKGTKSENIEGMHELRKYAKDMKNALVKGDFEGLVTSLNKGWVSKKKTSSAVSNRKIDKMYTFIMENGGKAAKISGAGGGGFMMILCEPKERFNLIEKLRVTGGRVMTPQFIDRGAQAWTIYE